MRAGKLDRRISIQEKVVTQDTGTGEEIVSWNEIASVWAQKVENVGQERFSSDQFVGKTARTFRFRWSNATKAVTVTHRIVFDGVEHDIQNMREIGRREGIEVDCTARSETQLDNA